MSGIWSKLTDNKGVTAAVAAVGLGGLVYWYRTAYLGLTRTTRKSKALRKNKLQAQLLKPAKSFNKSALRLLLPNSRAKSTSITPL